MEVEGFVLGDVKYSVRIRHVIADAPARSFIKGTKGHNAYFFCERCYRRGSYLGRVICRYKPPADLYSDKSFSERWYEPHHVSNSPLEKLKLGMITNIPIDYMHLICLGVVKKFLTVFYEGKRPHKLAPKHIALISRKIIEYKYCVPSDFNRKCRPMNRLKFWKATEFRLFILYLGPFVLYKILDKQRHEHFMLLHTAVYILATAWKDSTNVLLAKSLLDKFVSKTETIYGKEFMVYNVHSLLHISDEVLLHGQLDNFSAFCFESYMARLKNLVMSNSNQLAQVARRLSESNPISVPLEESKQLHATSSRSGDNCYLMSSGDICLVTRWEPPIKCKIFRLKQDVCFYPCKSSQLGIFEVGKLTGEVQILKSSLVRKCMFLKQSNESGYVLPLCHLDTK